MNVVGFVLVTTFLASAVEAIEMVTIVVGVGATRGWRATLVGAASGFLVLAIVVAVFGLALSAIPIGPLRLIVGALLGYISEKWGRTGRNSWLRLMANGKTIDEATRDVMGMPFADLDTQWRASLGSQPAAEPTPEKPR